MLPTPLFFVPLKTYWAYIGRLEQFLNEKMDGKAMTESVISVQEHPLGDIPLMVYTYPLASTAALGGDAAEHDSPQVPIFVVSHGLTNSVAREDQVGLPDWRPLAERLRLVRYDAYGHGQSGGDDQPERYDWARQVEDMASVLDWVHQRWPAAASKDILVGGCSMSTGVALHLMSQIATGVRPVPPWWSRVKALILTLPPAGWSERAQLREQYDRLSCLLAQQGMAQYLRAMALRPSIDYILADQPHYPQAAAAHAQTMTAQRLAAMFKGAAEVTYPEREALAQITIPTLLLPRTADAQHPVASAQTLQEILPVSAVFTAKSCEDIRSWPERVARLAFAVSVSDELLVAASE